MCILNNRSLNPFQEALCRAVPGHRGHSHCQRLPTPGRGTAAPPAGHLHQAVTQGGAQRCLGRSTWGGPATGEGDVSELLSSQKGRREATRRGVLGENKGASPRGDWLPRSPRVELSALLRRFENYSTFLRRESQIFF